MSTHLAVWRSPLVILTCGCLIGLIGFGPRSTFGFFLAPMDAANGWGRDQFGLKPIEMELFHGFIFLRLSPGPQPAVANLLAPFDADFAAYGLNDVLPVQVPDWSTDLAVNWKSVSPTKFRTRANSPFTSTSIK